MIYLLFTVLVVEGIVTMLLLVKIGPFRELTVKVLDQLTTGRGPATLITLASTMSMILLSSVLSIFKINNRGLKIGTLTPMDQVLWRTHLLEASLMDEWWMNFGIDDQALQNLAIRILSQTCSSSGCERNWSVFERIHTKRRNRLEHKRLNDLVYTHYNLRLKERQSSGKMDSLTDPISLENIDLTDEWVVEAEDDDVPLLDVSEIDDWMDVMDAIIDVGEGGAATGYSLFLGFIIYRLHHYLRKLISCRMSLVTSRVEAKKIQEEHLLLKEKEKKSSEETRTLKEEIARLNEKLHKLMAESDEKEKRAQDAEAHVTALQKQSEDLLLEYDRLLEDNQNLQSQSLGFKA